MPPTSAIGEQDLDDIAPQRPSSVHPLMSPGKRRRTRSSSSRVRPRPIRRRLSSSAPALIAARSRSLSLRRSSALVRSLPAAPDGSSRNRGPLMLRVTPMRGRPRLRLAHYPCNGCRQRVRKPRAPKASCPIGSTDLPFR